MGKLSKQEIAEAIDKIGMEFKKGTEWRHKKTGGVYRIDGAIFDCDVDDYKILYIDVSYGIPFSRIVGSFRDKFDFVE